MITICLFVTVCGIAVLCLSVGLWDTLEPLVLRIERKAKRRLCARWLAEDGMVAVKMEEGLRPAAFDIDDMVALINRF